MAVFTAFNILANYKFPLNEALAVRCTMDFEFDRYKKVYKEFSLLLDAGKELIELQVGLKPNYIHENYGEKIFIKLWCHGNTLLQLSPQISGSTKQLWDVSSHYAISRTLIETYEALFYISIDEVDEIERDFRIKFWRLHSEARRSQMLDLIGSKHPELNDVKKEVEVLHSQILGHPHLDKCENGLRTKLEKKKYSPYHIHQAERDRRAEINRDYHKAVVMQLSSHIHTHPFSVYQLMDFKAGDPECLSLMSISLQYSSAFLAKAIHDYSVLFQPRIPDYSMEVKNLLSLWKIVLKNGVKNS